MSDAFANRKKVAICLLAWAILVAGPVTVAVAQALSATIQDQYQQETERLAEQLTRQRYSGEPGDGTVTTWNIPRAPDRQTLFLPPDLAAKSAQHQPDSIRAALREHAVRVWQIAGQALEQGQWQLAYRLAFEVAAFDPSHADALRVVDDTAAEPSSPNRELSIHRGTQNHAILGWRAGRYWTAETDHFVIDSNDSPRAIRELAEVLEVLHAVWRQVFVDFWSSRQEIEGLFRGDRAPRDAIRHRVVLFASQQQYVRSLRRREPRIGMTLGVYRPADKTTYLFSQRGDSEDQRATWRHEATHQLFQETGQNINIVAEHGDAWIVEGVGMYMESLQRFDRCCTVGGIDSPRLQHARYRCLTEQQHEPLDRLIRLGREELQSRDDVRGLYSQAAGYTHFLMDGDDGAHRSALVMYLRDVYANTATPSSLAELAQVPVTDLETWYREIYLPVRDAELAFPRVSKAITKLSLGRCPVTSAGVAQLRFAPVASLTWLDLNHCNVDDLGVEWLDQVDQMRQLSLERTRISNATVERLAGMHNLEELDLAGTRIGDESIAAIASLPRLRVLWLTDTAVTDQGLLALAPLLKTLRQIDVTGTQVTREAVGRLRSEQPSLKITGGR